MKRGMRSRNNAKKVRRLMLLIRRVIERKEQIVPQRILRDT